MTNLVFYRHVQPTLRHFPSKLKVILSKIVPYRNELSNR